MSFQPPVQDLMFCLEHLSHWEKVSALNAYSDCELTDIAAALFYAQHILTECATEQTRILHGAQSLLDAAFPE